jgi:hypothetical protein
MSGISFDDLQFPFRAIDNDAALQLSMSARTGNSPAPEDIAGVSGLLFPEMRCDYQGLRCVCQFGTGYRPGTHPLSLFNVTKRI